MFAAGAHALLRARRTLIRPLVKAEKHILELIHPGIGKQQGRIIVRNERTRRHNLVAFGLKELEELVANFGAFHWIIPGRSVFQRGVILALNDTTSDEKALSDQCDWI